MSSHSKATVARVMELRKTLSLRETARVMGIDPRSVTRAQAQARGGPKRSPKLPTKEQLSRALELLSDGTGYAEAARTTGVNKLRLAREFPGMGMSTQEKVQFASLARRYRKALDNPTIKTVD